jgi:hypothetical protein
LIFISWILRSKSSMEVENLTFSPTFDKCSVPTHCYTFIENDHRYKEKRRPISWQPWKENYRWINRTC